MNSALRLAFLLIVEGLGFFFRWLPEALLLVSKEKVKSEPIEREKLKTWPWLTSVWQKARHLDAMESSPLAAVLILEPTSELRVQKT